MANKIGVNEPCPCGSGKKYKKCCMSLERVIIPATESNSALNKSIFDEEDDDFGYDFSYCSYGAVDKSGKTVIPLKYDYLAPFSEGLAQAVIQNRHGFIDVNGDVAIFFKYHIVGHFTKENLAVVKQKDKYGYVDKAGNEVIPCIFDEADYFIDGISAVRSDGLWGFIDTTGKEVIPFEYSAYDGCEDGYMIAEKDDLWGVIDETNKILVPFKYHNIFYVGEGLFMVALNNIFAFVDHTGRELTPFRYGCEFDRERFVNGYAHVLNEDSSKCGVIDKTGTEVLPLDYDDIIVLKNNLFAIYKDDKCGIIDKSKNIIIPIKYDNIDPNTDDETAPIPVEKDGKWGLINLNDETVMTFVYDSISPAGKGFFRVERNKKYGFIDYQGEETSLIIYDNDYTVYKNGFIIVSKNHKYGIIDENGKEIVPLKYDRIENFDDNGLAVVGKYKFD